MHRNTAATTLLALVALAAPAGAQTATFDDLDTCSPTNTSGALVPASYLGLNWINVGIIDAVAADTLQYDGFLNGLVSGNCVGVNAYAEVARISSSTPFTFDGGYFTAGPVTGVVAQITGYMGTSQVFTEQLTLNSDTPYELVLNKPSIDLLTIAPVSWYVPFIVVDNLRFTTTAVPSVAPEPATITLVASGLGLLGVAGVRRRRRGS